MWWQQPWVWLAGALVLGIAETILPGFVLLGFALGAAAVALFLWLGLVASAPALGVVFAGVSLLAWLGMRRWMPRQRGEVREIERDINK